MDDWLTKFYLSSSRDKDAVVVSNIPVSETEATIENCIEVICKDEEIDELYFHGDGKGRKLLNVALLFLNGKVKDVKAIQKRAIGKKLTGHQLEFEVLPPPQGIVVYDVPNDATSMELELYFDRAKLIGDNNEVTEVELHDQIQIAVVQFKNPAQALLKILSIPQILKNKSLAIEPYYGKFHDIVIEVLQDNVPSRIYEKFVETEVDSVLYDGLNKSTLIPDKSSPDSNANKEEYHRIFTKTGESNPSEHKGFNNAVYDDGSWVKPNDRLDGNKSRVRILSSDDEDDDGYMKPACQPHAIDGGKGHKGKVEFSQSSRSEHIYMDIEESLVPPKLPVTQRPSERRKMGGNALTIQLEKEKILLLRIHRFSEECKICNIDLDSNHDCVVFTGDLSNFQAAKLKMLEILDQVEQATKRIPKSQATLLKSSSRKLGNILKKAVYSILGDDTLCCKAFSKKEAEKAIEVLMKEVEHCIIKYTEANFKYLNSAEWTNFEKKIKKEKKVELAVVREQKVILVDGFSKECLAAVGEIRKNLNKNADASTEKIEIKGSKSVCFYHGYKRDLEQQNQDMRKRNGELSYKHEKLVLTIEIKGDRALLEDTKTAINSWEANIWEGPVDLDRISKKDTDLRIMSRALDSVRGRKFLKEFEEKNKCGVKVENKKGIELPAVKSSPSLHSHDKPELRRRNTEPNFHGGARPKEFTSAAGNTWLFDQTEIILKEGNIVRERASVLVHVKSEECSLTTGRISKDFLKQGGPEFESTYFRACQGNDGAGVYMSAKTGELKCGRICHVVLPKYNGDKSILTRYVRECFKKCSLIEAECVAMPAVGTGRILRYPIDVVVECLVYEAKEAARRSNYIKKIKFVIYDEGTVDAFRSKLQGSGATWRHNSTLFESTDHKAEVKEDRKKEITSVVSLELFALSKTEGEKLRKTLSKDIRDTFLFEETCSDTKLKNLPKDTWKRMTSAANKNHVWLEQDGSTLRLKGEKDEVIKSKSDVLETLLKDTRNHMPERLSSRRYDKYTSGWWTEKSVAKTEVPVYWKHFQKDEGLLDRGVDAISKLVRLGRLVEVDHETCKNIQNLVQNTWDGNLVGQGSDAKNLGHRGLRIKKVERIENFELFDKYQTTKKAFYRKLASRKKYSKLENISTQGKKLAKGPVLTGTLNRSLTVDLDLFSHANEFYFFHGTPDEYVDNIVNKGLDEKHGGEKAMFGQGIYGAESSTKADQYADVKGQRIMKNRKMLLMRLLLGDICVVNKAHKYKMPPCSDCFEETCTNSKHQPFDSVVADGQWLFREFVVYRREQCYPEYLITYDRV